MKITFDPAINNVVDLKIDASINSNAIVEINTKITNGIAATKLFGAAISFQPKVGPNKIPAHNSVHKNDNTIKIIPTIITEKTKNTGLIFVAPIRFIKTLFLNFKIVCGIIKIPTDIAWTIAIEPTKVWMFCPGLLFNYLKANPFKNNNKIG